MRVGPPRIDPETNACARDVEIEIQSAYFDTRTVRIAMPHRIASWLEYGQPPPDGPADALAAAMFDVFHSALASILGPDDDEG